MSEWEKVADALSPLLADGLDNDVYLKRLIAAGYAIVPRAPNINMVVAGNDAYNKGHFYDTAQEFRPVWSAMLAAGEVKPEEEGRG